MPHVHTYMHVRICTQCMVLEAARIHVRHALVWVMPLVYMSMAYQGTLEAKALVYMSMAIRLCTRLMRVLVCMPLVTCLCNCLCTRIYTHMPVGGSKQLWRI